MHLQNATLYFCGVVCNLITFFFIPSPAVTPGIGFLQGLATCDTKNGRPKGAEISFAV